MHDLTRCCSCNLLYWQGEACCACDRWSCQYCMGSAHMCSDCYASVISISQDPSTTQEVTRHNESEGEQRAPQGAWAASTTHRPTMRDPAAAARGYSEAPAAEETLRYGSSPRSYEDREPSCEPSKAPTSDEGKDSAPPPSLSGPPASRWPGDGLLPPGEARSKLHIAMVQTGTSFTKLRPMAWPGGRPHPAKC